VASSSTALAEPPTAAKQPPSPAALLCSALATRFVSLQEQLSGEAAAAAPFVRGAAFRRWRRRHDARAFRRKTARLQAQHTLRRDVLEPWRRRATMQRQLVGVVSRWIHLELWQCCQQWAKVATQQRLRAQCIAAVSRMRHGQLWAGWSTWLDVLESWSAFRSELARIIGSWSALRDERATKPRTPHATFDPRCCLGLWQSKLRWRWHCAAGRPTSEPSESGRQHDHA
jgi:hypothetical protein